MSAIIPKDAEQRSAEHEIAVVHAERGPFVVAADMTRMPMVFTDAKADGDPIVFANDAFLELSGFAREEVLGQRFDFMLHDRVDPASGAAITAAFAGDTDPDVCFQRKDGEGFWATILVSPVRDAGGTVVQHFASFIDQTARRAEAAQAQMLLDELNHRVKNTLATVQSIVTQGLRGATDPAAIRESIDSRLLALSRSHDLLTADSWEGIGLGDIVHAALAPFGVGDARHERFEVVGDDIRMPPQATLALGIAFHELATNAVKYGAFSTDAGCIRISWTIEPPAGGTGSLPPPGGERLIIRWREEDGPPVTPPTRKGFGSRVIERGLTHELGGSVALTFPVTGVVCTIDLPAPPVPPLRPGSALTSHGSAAASHGAAPAPDTAVAVLGSSHE